jgi:hypothetical protein
MPLDQTANFQRAEITNGFPMAAEDDDVYFIGADRFPDPSNGEYNLVIFDQTQFARPDQDPNVEIVRATSRLSNVELAVDRGQEGTEAADHPAGSAVLLSATAKVFEDISQGYERSVTASSDVTAEDRQIVLGDASGGALTVTLPAVSDAQLVTVKKIDSSSNAVTITAPGNELIDNKSSIDMDTQFQARELTSDGTNYFII